MLSFFKRKKSANKSRDYLYKKNELQLQREEVSLKYDLIRSFAK